MLERWRVKQVTVVHQGALGDTVVLIPLFGSLRQHFAEEGGCAITLVTRMNLGQMLMMMGFVEAHASADDRDHSAWFAPPPPLRRRKARRPTACQRGRGPMC